MEDMTTQYNFNVFGMDTSYDLMLNDSLSGMPELECYLTFYNRSYPESGSHCNTTWDGLSCWPLTSAPSSAVIPCFKEFNGVKYDISQNASRECYSNATWANWSDYSRCKALLHEDEGWQVLWDVKEAATIYYCGYGLSLIALAIALWIFIYFKDLRCLRNTVHTNLMITYLFIDLTWIIAASLQSSTSEGVHKASCMLVIVLTYLMETNFFWMFVEGLYLYILVVKTFSVESVKWQLYAVIGWGVPFLVVLVWAIVKPYLTSSWHRPSKDSIWLSCPWQTRDHYDYIFVTPVLLVLLVNIYFLGQIMFVLITKLRAATSVESKQYRKAAKALLVLIPLLGLTYVVVIVTPTHRTARVVFSYAQAALLSTQGFTVAVLYCFMNGEVRKSVRHHFEQWRDQRGLGQGNRQNLGLSSRNGGGGFKRYSGRGVRDRASCISLSTSGTWLSSNYNIKPHQAQVGQRPSNGSYSPVPTKDDAL